VQHEQDNDDIGPNFLFPAKSYKKRKSTDDAEVIDIETKEDVHSVSQLRRSDTKSLNGDTKKSDIVEQDTSGSYSQYSVVDVDEDTNYNDTVFKALDKKKKVLGSGKQFKYVEPIRKKAERDLLPGHECDQCQKV
jgi:hypothetical protein